MNIQNNIQHTEVLMQLAEQNHASLDSLANAFHQDENRIEDNIQAQ